MVPIDSGVGGSVGEAFGGCGLIGGGVPLREALKFQKFIMLEHLLQPSGPIDLTDILIKKSTHLIIIC